MRDNRFNIGLLVANITDIFSNNVAKGAMEAAERLDVDLTIFPGKYIGIQDKYDEFDTTYEYQYNVLFSHAAEAKLDYLIVATGTIAYALDNDKKKEFLDSLGDTKILSLAAEIEGYDFLQFNNRSGIEAAVNYLAAQGRKHIGIMAGNLNHSECAERYDAYRKSLDRNGLKFKDSYLMTSDISERCRSEAERLIDLNPELDAVICINDKIASVICQVIKERGKCVGKDVAVTGFDDMPIASELDPPLATIKADAAGLGARAVEKALNYLNGVTDNDHYFQTQFIPRSSCSKNDHIPKNFTKLSENEKLTITQKYTERIHRDNIFIRDALMFGGDLKHSYAKIMKQLSLLGAVNSYLYIFDKPVTYHFDGEFPKDVTWLFKAYSCGKETHTVPDEEQKISASQLYRNKYLAPDRQHTLIAADLYTAETQYGLALLEPAGEEFFDELELVTYQLSSAVRTLDIMRKQEKLLSELHSRNLALEKQSKIDELTKIYNRRGFYVAADELICSEENQDGTFIVCYADMDNLKMVNDTYGHIEGDFSLKLVAECLKTSFGSRAVIGRMGGDEYAAIVPKTPDISAEEIISRKEKFIEDFNRSGQKPYVFGVSMGIFECVCNNSYDLKDSLDKADDLLYIQKKKRKKII